MKRWYLPLLFLLWCIPGLASGTPQHYFKIYQPALYQVQLVDIESNEKSVIGSGFRVSSDGRIITNYHVVGDYIFDPQNYRIIALTQDGLRDTLQLINFDILHDCAVLQSNLKGTPVLPLALQNPAHGERMYAIGNPYDLGMTIVEGNYNGLVEKSFYDKMHFSGSLNPGMSGGPAINQQGEVVGINVSTGGDQISFIVPIRYIDALLHEAPLDSLTEEVLQKRIGDQLYANQERLVKNLLDASWPTADFGPCSLPEAISEVFSASGHSKTDDERSYSYHYKSYAMNDNVYIADGFQLGDIEYGYQWYEAGDLNPSQFAQLLTNRSASLSLGNNWFYLSDDEVDTATKTRYIRLGDTPWKALLGITNLVDYPDLYKISLNLTAVGNSKESMIVKVRINGVSKENGTALLKKFMEHIVWNR
ncbi:MAG: trypsin-like peptidase domain-containing protein [Candidatus Cloacimonetes bacterium]|nr:trypsin-like peptidase domain-containing protein [Candidatus Cloacimonadota bacterium]